MSRNKCPKCGLVNVGTVENCRRCGAPLQTDAPPESHSDEEKVTKRGIGRRLIWIFSVTLFLLFAFYMSLLITSDDLGFDRRQIVEKAVVLLGQNGFSRESFVLAHLRPIAGQIIGGTSTWAITTPMPPPIFLSRWSRSIPSSLRRQLTIMKERQFFCMRLIIFLARMKRRRLRASGGKSKELAGLQRSMAKQRSGTIRER